MKKLDALDLYKTLAAVMVILIHVTATPVVTLKSGCAVDVLILLNRFAKPSVPMFIFASGFALLYSYHEKVFHYSEFLTKRLTKILIPYLVWCAIYYAYYVSEDIYPADPVFFIQQVINGKMIYHLYFVVIIIQFYLLFALFLGVVKRAPGTLVLPAALLLNLLAVSVIPPEFIGRSFPSYLTYFLLGCYFGKDPDLAISTLKKWKWLVTILFLGSGALYTLQFYEDQVLGLGYRYIPDSIIYIFFSILAILFYYVAAMTIEVKAPEMMKKSMLRMSRGSYYIYLSHPAAMIVAGEVALAIGMQGVIDKMLLSLLLIFVAVVPLSVLYSGIRKNMRS